MHRFTVQFPDELWHQLSLRCEQEGKTITDYIRTTLERRLDEIPVLRWGGDPLLKLKGRFRTRERLRESVWRSL